MARKRKIIERYPGKFYARIQRDGRRQWIKLGDTLSTARDTLRLLEDKLTRERLGLTQKNKQGPLLFQDAALAYLNHSYEIHAETTHTMLLKRVRYNYLPRFKGLYLSEIDKAELDAYVRELTGRGLAPSTISVHVNDLRQIFQHNAIHFPKLKLPRHTQPPIIIPTDDEIKRYLAHCPGYWKPIPLTMLYCGHRPIEIQNAQKADVDRDRQYLSIAADASLKNAYGRRIPIHPELWPVIQAQLETEGPYLYPTRYGERRTRLAYIHHKVRKQCGLEYLRLYHLRHAFCTRLLETGTDPATVSKLMGHGSEQLTLRIYHHLRDIPAEKAISRVPGL